MFYEAAVLLVCFKLRATWAAWRDPGEKRNGKYRRQKRNEM